MALEALSIEDKALRGPAEQVRTMLQGVIEAFKAL